MDAPKFKSSWRGTFGAYLLCSRDTASKIVLQRVGWNAADDAPPMNVEPGIRVVDETTPRSTLIGYVKGTPWKPWGSVKFPGRYYKTIADRTISQSCAELKEDRYRVFTELFFVVESGKRGSDLKNAYVDYRADGKPYRLTIRWEMISCGDAIEARATNDC